MDHLGRPHDISSVLFPVIGLHCLNTYLNQGLNKYMLRNKIRHYTTFHLFLNEFFDLK